MDINPLQSLANYRRFVAVMLHRPTVVRSTVVGWPASGFRLGRRDSPPRNVEAPGPGRAEAARQQRPERRRVPPPVGHRSATSKAVPNAWRPRRMAELFPITLGCGRLLSLLADCEPLSRNVPPTAIPPHVLPAHRATPLTHPPRHICIAEAAQSVRLQPIYIAAARRAAGR